MSPTLRLALLRARWRIAALALGLALFMYLVGLSFAAVDQSTIRSLVESLPPALRAFSGAADLGSAGGFLGATFVHPVPLTIQGALAISLATGPARDIESGLGELMLSRPEQRWRWLLAHGLATAAGLTAAVVAALAGSAIAVATVDDLGAVSAGRLVETAVGALLLALALGAVSLLAGAVTRRGATAVGWAAGFAVVSYALNYLAQIWTIAEPLGPLSIYHYFDPGRMLAQTGLDAGDALPLIGVTVVAGVLAHLAIGRGDVA